MRLWKKTLIVVGAAALATACAPYRATCAWLDLSDNSAVRVTSRRLVTAPQECSCVRCGAPGRFEIRRDGYVLEFWNGDRWYPELYVRATGTSGQQLRLESDQLVTLGKTDGQAPSLRYDYYGKTANLIDGKGGVAFKFPARLVVGIVDDRGQVLGREEIVVRLEQRRHFAIDSL
jgi:hypothetical protein